MASIVQKLIDNKIILDHPNFLKNNLHYEVIMGSFAYGVSSDMSDVDIYGFCIPPKDIVFPHTGGEIFGFGKQKKRFENYQKHHIKDPNLEREYDIDIFNIVKYFNLVMQNNPNMIDSLFVPERCVIHSTSIGRMVREKRKIFLHKGCIHTYRGYSFAQLHKIEVKNPTGKRKELIEKFGYDVKFAYHIVRLLLEVEQILIEQDLNLERNSEILKSIRRGDWTLEQIKEWFYNKEKQLEELYNKSTLSWGPDEDSIKELLLNCLEHHYGSLSKSEIIIPNRDQLILNDLREILEKYK